MEKAIRVAEKKGKYKAIKIYGGLYDSEELGYDYKAILLDPLFWQALGKGLGWGKGRKFSFIVPTKKISRVNPQITYIRKEHIVTRKSRPMKKEWLYHQHQLIDSLANGESIEEFFKKLIK